MRELGVKTRECELEKISKYTFKIILTQGVNRQIRRMCDVCGYHVKSIKRVRVMNITLGSLKPGEYVELPKEDIKRLYCDCGIKPPRNLY